MMLPIKIVGTPPKRMTHGSSGFDLTADVETEKRILPGHVLIVPTGIWLEIPAGFEGQVRSRSGLSTRHGICVVNGIGTIDSDYRGEVCAPLINLGNECFVVLPGMRIAQLVFVPVCHYVCWEAVDPTGLCETSRGDSGFGSTGL